MKQVIIARDVYAPDTWTRATVDDVFDYLKTQFDVWPETARLYHNYVALEHDVTPDSQADLDQLRPLDGVFYVIVYPGLTPVEWLILAVSVVTSVAVALLMPMPAIPSTGRNSAQGSPNNELSSRGNKPRPNGRIPDIFGTVRSTPDLIAVPYSVFENNVEVEHMVGVVGRGTFDIKDAYDSETRIDDISGASVQLYELDADIDTGTPFKVFGDLITDTPHQTAKSNSVNGQVLRPPNAIDFGGSNDVYFEYPNLVKLDPSSERDFRDVFKDIFSVLSPVRISDAGFNLALDLNGTYIITSVTKDTLTLNDPAATNANWLILQAPNNVDGRTDGRTANKSSLFTVVSFGAGAVGGFVLEDPQRTHVILNFVALNGLYKENGDAQYSYHADLQITVEQIDENDEPLSATDVTTVTMVGSSTQKETVARTVYFETSFVGRCRVSVRRTSDTDRDFAGTVVDEVKWRDLYAAKYLSRVSYGDTTVVRARTRATTGALSVKERKLNFLVQRKLPTYNPTTGTMTTTRTATNSAADAFAAVCLDAFIGRRDVSEVDLAGIYQAIADVVAYFGTSSAAEFCYTFDRENQSFEEIATTIAQAVFCEAYRQGNQIKLSFERETDDSVLLFNHRNKVPKSEKRTITFGIENSFDGVEYEWIDPADDTKTVLKIPNDAITNPKKITSVGVRNARQAHFSAWRVWNKLRYQRESVEFEALRESDLLVRKDRILVADNTRTGTQDGEIETQTGLIVTTSQPCALDPAKSYTMHLQLYDGSVDAIGCTAGADAYHVVLERAPLLPLVLEHDRYLRTIYMITSNDDARAKAFLVGEKSNAGRMTNSLKCVNYDARYYQNDSDFKDALIP